MRYDLYLTIFGMELVYHNILYEHHAMPLITDSEYDQLNKKYFDLCDKHNIAPTKGLNRDSGMMEETALVQTLRPRSAADLRHKLKKVMEHRKKFEKSIDGVDDISYNIGKGQD